MKLERNSWHSVSLAAKHFWVFVYGTRRQAISPKADNFLKETFLRWNGRPNRILKEKLPFYTMKTTNANAMLPMRKKENLSDQSILLNPQILRVFVLHWTRSPTGTRTRKTTNRRSRSRQDNRIGSPRVRQHNRSAKPRPRIEKRR